jgi:hypothetical protein
MDDKELRLSQEDEKHLEKKKRVKQYKQEIRKVMKIYKRHEELLCNIFIVK